MALDDSGARPVAGQREFEMLYSGSLLKVAALYAAHQLRVAVNDFAATLDLKVVDTSEKLFNAISAAFDNEIDRSMPRIQKVKEITREMRVPTYRTIFQAEQSGGFWRLKFRGDTGFLAATGGPNFEPSDTFAVHLRKMIVGSVNASAGFCIRALGYSWINGLLQSAGFLNFDFPGSEGIWLAGDFGNQWTASIPSVNDGDVKQATTCFHMAWLYALLHDKKLVKNDVNFATGMTGNDEMLKLLEFAAVYPPPSLFENVPHSFTVMHTKIGVGPMKKSPQGGVVSCLVPDRGCVLSEASVLRHPQSGRKFVAVWQNVLWDGPYVGVRRVAAIIDKTMKDYADSEAERQRS